MAQTKQTARITTDGHAKHVVLGQLIGAAMAAAAQINVEMHPAMPTLNLQVSTHCIVKHLWNTMTVIFYSIMPFAKMGANFGFVMRKIASMQSALPVSRSLIRISASSNMMMLNLHVYHVFGKSVRMSVLSILQVPFLFLFFFLLKNIWILQGFTINRKPVLKNFIKVKGTFETAIRATICSPPHHSC
jgi:hypothetical protein